MLDHGLGAILALSNNLSLLIVTKFQLKPPGIDPATSCLVAQYPADWASQHLTNLYFLFCLSKTGLLLCVQCFCGTVVYSSHVQVR